MKLVKVIRLVGGGYVINGTPNGFKWHQTAPNGFKWIQTAPNISIKLKIAPNCSK